VAGENYRPCGSDGLVRNTLAADIMYGGKTMNLPAIQRLASIFVVIFPCDCVLCYIFVAIFLYTVWVA